ncbi:MAG: hypothetical protein IKW21_01285 [Lachnospiraceae bacterium]|nr:hypothetical protein [Lachnospiraceae bacterium]
MAEEKEIKDSGQRTEFESGAVRDMQGEDKGACHLLPLDVIAEFFDEDDDGVRETFINIQRFLDDFNVNHLYVALALFAYHKKITIPQMMLEVSVHYRDGAKKYKPHNWKLGIPVSSYISSGVRHLLKDVDGQCDERHDRAFVWNMLGAIWTMKHKPELNDLPSIPAMKGGDSDETCKG